VGEILPARTRREDDGLKSAIIVGAGIGGLTAAIGLRRAGLEVKVFEKRTDPRMIESGGGMVVQPNAIRGLQELDVGDRVAAAGSALEHFEWHTPSGKRLASWPVGTVGREVGAPMIGIRRMRLQGALAGAVEEGTLLLGAEVTGLSEDGDGVTVQLASGAEERGDLLIGADGINSTVRSLSLHPWTKPRYAGYALWFGITELDTAATDPPTFRELDGPGARFIFFPVGGREIYWSAIANAPEGVIVEGGGQEIAGDKEVLLDRYAGWAEPTEALIAATDLSAIYRREIADRDPIEKWGNGRISLLGDAAHAMTINLGQGACQAMEDGVVLAKCLAAEEDTVAALRAYEAKRIPRTAPIVRRSRMIGELGQWKNPLACRVRNQIQRVVFPTVAFREFKQTVAYEF
jgi:2-polyprenyl-6-methoxyphenol hydroxylase-like FAD-dependent oxidoreductase